MGIKEEIYQLKMKISNFPLEQKKLHDKLKEKKVEKAELFGELLTLDQTIDRFSLTHDEMTNTIYVCNKIAEKRNEVILKRKDTERTFISLRKKNLETELEIASIKNMSQMYSQLNDDYSNLSNDDERPQKNQNDSSEMIIKLMKEVQMNLKYLRSPSSWFRERKKNGYGFLKLNFNYLFYVQNDEEIETH